MQLSQSALFYLFCASFLAGLALSLFYDVLYCTRIWMMPPQIRYSVGAIQKMRVSRPQKRSAKKAKGLSVAVFFEDVLFCIVCALTLILLLYWLNNGAFRAAAPLFMAAGFFLWRISISKGFRIALQWIAFGIETVIYTLCIPIKRLFTWIVQKYKKNAQIRHIKRSAKQREAYTKQELQNIAKTAERLLPIEVKSRMQKGESHARKSKKAV